MRQEGKVVSIAQLCRWFTVPRSSFYYTTRRRGPGILDAALTMLVREIIDANPTYGLRRITALLRRQVDRQINRKAVHRIVKHHGWQVWQKPQGKRPRVAAWPSRATQPNQRWAIDTTHLFTSQDGWCQLTAIIDCCDRTIVGWRLSRSGIARVAAGALEDALRDREIDSTTNLSLRSDNGLVFGAKAFVRVTRRYSVSQEYITPYSPEAERDDRAFLQDAEGRVRVAAPLPRSRPRLRRHRNVARALRRRAATLGARIPHAEGVPREISCLTCTKTRGTPHPR